MTGLHHHRRLSCSRRGIFLKMRKIVLSKSFALTFLCICNCALRGSISNWTKPGLSALSAGTIHVINRLSMISLSFEVSRVWWTSGSNRVRWTSAVSFHYEVSPILYLISKTCSNLPFLLSLKSYASPINLYLFFSALLLSSLGSLYPAKMYFPLKYFSKASADECPSSAFKQR